ncbi:hypothetical protein HDU98_006963 [Podochytrium sp. JEL0797]|nr:hypothetical protein HDU98_006963 [Podochytrium sp. JEL0797]
MNAVLLVAAAASVCADGVVLARADAGTNPYPLKMPLASGYQALYAPGYSWGQKFTTFNASTTSFAACANIALPGNTVSALITWDSITGLCSLGNPIPSSAPQAALFAFGTAAFSGDIPSTFDLGGGGFNLGTQTTAQPCLDKCAAYSGAGWCALVLWNGGAFGTFNCYLKGPDLAPATVTAGVWVMPSPTATAITAAAAATSAAATTLSMATTATSATAKATVTSFSMNVSNSNATTASGGDGGSNGGLIGGIVAVIVVLGLVGGGYTYWRSSKKTTQVEEQELKPSQPPFSDNPTASLSSVEPDTDSTVIQVPVEKESSAVARDIKTVPVAENLMTIMGAFVAAVPPRDTKSDYYDEPSVVATDATEKTDYYGDDPTVAVSAFEAKGAAESATSHPSVAGSSSHQVSVLVDENVLSWTLQDVSTWVMKNGGSAGAGLRTASEKITGRVLTQIEETELVQVAQPVTVGDRHELLMALRALKMKAQLVTGPPAYFDF